MMLLQYGPHCPDVCPAAPSGDVPRGELLALAKRSLEKIKRYHEKRMQKPPPVSAAAEAPPSFGRERQGAGRTAASPSRGKRRGGLAHTCISLGYIPPQAPIFHLAISIPYYRQCTNSVYILIVCAVLLSGSRDRPQQGAPSSPPRGPGPRIDDLISTALTKDKGPVTKDSLRKEWASLAGQIQKQELHGEIISRYHTLSHDVM